MLRSTPLPRYAAPTLSCVRNARRRSQAIPAAAAKGFSVEQASRKEFRDIAGPFITSFFKDSDSLSDSATRRLVSAAATDLDQRYGGRGDRALFVARFDDDGAVAGCAGVEAVPFDGLKPAKGTASSSSRVVQRPLVANLAVVRAARRKGLARLLMRECEQTARGWGFDEAVLLVDARNSAARSLYEGLGYKVQGAPQEATALTAREGAVVEEEVRNVLMRKSLKPFPAGALENARLERLALAAAALAAIKVAGAAGLADGLAEVFGGWGSMLL